MLRECAFHKRLNLLFDFFFSDLVRCIYIFSELALCIYGQKNRELFEVSLKRQIALYHHG